MGIAVSVLIAPPLYLQPAGAALGDLAGRMADFSRDFAGGLRGGWTRAASQHWLNQAREVADEVARAERTVSRAEESARFNPRGQRTRDARPRLRTALTGLERCYVTLRTLARAVLDRTYYVPEHEQAYTADQRTAIADVLDCAAEAIEAVARSPPTRTPSWPAARWSPTWPRCGSTATGCRCCSPSTRAWTRPPGSSTAPCWPRSTGSSWRSSRRPGNRTTSGGSTCPTGPAEPEPEAAGPRTGPPNRDRPRPPPGEPAIHRRAASPEAVPTPGARSSGRAVGGCGAPGPREIAVEPGGR